MWSPESWDSCRRISPVTGPLAGAERACAPTNERVCGGGYRPHGEKEDIRVDAERVGSELLPTKKSEFPVMRLREDKRIVELVEKTDKRILAVWAIDCAERVLPYFDRQYPEDGRPRRAIQTLQSWIDTGAFKMAVIRKASLDSHKAASEVGEDSAARSAARAAGHAVATAHVLTHSMGSAIYALQAIHRATGASDADAAVAKERDWQYQHLLTLRGGLASQCGRAS